MLKKICCKKFSKKTSKKEFVHFLLKNIKCSYFKICSNFLKNNQVTERKPARNCLRASRPTSYRMRAEVNTPRDKAMNRFSRLHLARLFITIRTKLKPGIF
jgi:hypothetical protein